MSRLRTVAPALGLVVCLAACSSPQSGRAAEPAAVLASEALTALGKVPEVQMSGSVSTPKGVATSSSITLTDIRETHSDSEGTIAITGNPSNAAGEHFTGSVRYVIVNEITWVDGSHQFWLSLFRSDGAGAAEAAGLIPKLESRWIELVSASTTAFNEGTLGLIDPRGFAEQFLHDSAGKFANHGTASVDGKPVVSLVAAKGATADLPETGTLLPVDLRTQSQAALVTRLRYSYPAAAPIAPPAHFEYFDTVLKTYHAPKPSE